MPGGPTWFLFFTRSPFSLPIYLAALPALVITALIGLAQDRFVFAPLRHGNRITLLIASIGLSYFLRNSIRLIWGSDLQTYGLMPTRGMEFAGLSITSAQITMVAAAILFLATLYVILSHTMLGKSLRAVADNMALAQIMGISIKKVSAAVWVLASLFSAAGGILLAVDTNLEPMMGLTNLIKTFAAVLLGGAGNVWGALLGGLVIGVAENFSVAFISPGYKDFVSFALIILMLLYRPRGIFGILGGVR